MYVKLCREDDMDTPTFLKYYEKHCTKSFVFLALELIPLFAENKTRSVTLFSFGCTTTVTHTVPSTHTHILLITHLILHTKPPLASSTQSVPLSTSLVLTHSHSSAIKGGTVLVRAVQRG